MVLLVLAGYVISVGLAAYLMGYADRLRDVDLSEEGIGLLPIFGPVAILAALLVILFTGIGKIPLIPRDPLNKLYRKGRKSI